AGSDETKTAATNRAPRARIFIVCYPLAPSFQIARVCALRETDALSRHGRGRLHLPSSFSNGSLIDVRNSAAARFILVGAIPRSRCLAREVKTNGSDARDLPVRLRCWSALLGGRLRRRRRLWRASASATAGSGSG